MHTTPTASSPGIWDLLRIWAGIGLQSFGGGASTQLLIRRTFVEQRAWLDMEEFSRFWNLCQLTPGINLIALTVLIGRKLGGARGIAVSLAGLLLPSAAVTCGLAVAYSAIAHSTIIHALLRGVVPATAGIMAVMAYGFIQPIIRHGRQEGARSLSGSIVIMLIASLVLISGKAPVPLVLIAVAALSALLFTPGRLLPAPVSRPVPDGMDPRA
jgi:chromate transporter